MNDERKNKVLEILDYWKTIEFLGQIDIAREKNDNKKLVEKILNGGKITEKKIEIHTEIITPYVDMEQSMEIDEERFKTFSSVGADVSFCIGEISRNSIVEYLEKFIEHSEERPEIVYPKNSAIAWFSFKTDMEGNYISKSFRLSPLLWAISVWEKARAERNQDFVLNTEKYDEIASCII